MPAGVTNGLFKKKLYSLAPQCSISTELFFLVLLKMHKIDSLQRKILDGCIKYVDLIIY